MSAEYAQGIPSGLIACRVGEENVHILGISPTSVLLRSAAPLPSAPISFYFYQIKTGEYLPHPLNDYKAEEARRENGAVLSRFFFSDPVCAALIRRSLNDYARYVETRVEAGASAYGQASVGYPLEKEDIFPSSLQEARQTWFSALPANACDAAPSFAVSLNCHSLYTLYLTHPADTFMRAYAQSYSIPASFLPNHPPERLYIGNEYCRLVFPNSNTLSALLKKAQAEQIAVTLVTAEMRSGEEDRADMLLSLAAEHGLEVEINDWGMLWRAQFFRNDLTLLFGTQLNRRRKDPRMAWKSGSEAHKELLSRNALNDASYRNFLAELGISRFEYESCALPVHPAEGKCSLHLPFYQTNTSLWCPLRALCENGNRGAQQGTRQCPHWCEDNVLLYPTHLKMLGRWNSLLAMDDNPLAFPVGFDRWVFNF